MALNMVDLPAPLGAMVGQYQNAADINGGTGIVVIGLACPDACVFEEGEDGFGFQKAYVGAPAHDHKVHGVEAHVGDDAGQYGGNAELCLKKCGYKACGHACNHGGGNGKQGMGVLLILFLGTRLGLSIRATGDNMDMVRASSINPAFTIIYLMAGRRKSRAFFD